MMDMRAKNANAVAAPPHEKHCMSEPYKAIILRREKGRLTDTPHDHGIRKRVQYLKPILVPQHVFRPEPRGAVSKCAEIDQARPEEVDRRDKR